MKSYSCNSPFFRVGSLQYFNFLDTLQTVKVRLAKYARIALDSYISQKDQGIDPVFDPAILGNEKGIYAWGENAADGHHPERTTH